MEQIKVIRRLVKDMKAILPHLKSVLLYVHIAQKQVKAAVDEQGAQDWIQAWKSLSLPRKEVQICPFLPTHYLGWLVMKDEVPMCRSYTWSSIKSQRNGSSQWWKDDLEDNQKKWIYCWERCETPWRSLARRYVTARSASSCEPQRTSGHRIALRISRGGPYKS